MCGKIGKIINTTMKIVKSELCTNPDLDFLPRFLWSDAQ
ncbi:hypothetical protein NHE_0429 [Neorickettsia helminthoeca str. Oregon]|uniref:Uncharacterized protein n=1 Tax=Neorickettsia helminthoeca str. Oregon TaxID=1286528 RepID=X5HJV7_9RICK|nr:hypothetical protein NHE_0429 [Neorickettsia helminthoeca str. Oregon]